MPKQCPQPIGKRSSQAGMTLLEVVIALGVLFIVTVGIMGLAAVAVVTTENQGHLMARTAEYAQDKMEQLLSLNFNDTSTDTISTGCVAYLVTAACSPSATEVGLAVGGSSNALAPANHYVDYLDATGTPLGGGAVAPAGWFYIRVWEICYLQPAGTCNTTASNLKRITVTTSVQAPIASRQKAPESTLVSLKSSPF